AIADPAVLAVVAAKAVGQLEGLPAIEGVTEPLEAAGTVVGVNPFGPPRPDGGLQPEAAELDPGLVHVVASALDVGPPDHDGGLLGDGADLRLGGGEPGLESLALGDVAERDDQTHRSPVADDRRRRVGGEEPRAVLAGENLVALSRLGGAERREDRARIG